MTMDVRIKLYPNYKAYRKFTLRNALTELRSFNYYSRLNDARLPHTVRLCQSVDQFGGVVLVLDFGMKLRLVYDVTLFKEMTLSSYREQLGKFVLPDESYIDNAELAKIANAARMFIGNYEELLSKFYS